MVLDYMASRLPGGAWTREDMELTIRRVMRDSMAIDEFSLDDEFARDLTIN